MKFVSHRRRRMAVRAKDVNLDSRRIPKRSRSSALIVGLATAAAVAAPTAASAATVPPRPAPPQQSGTSTSDDNTAGTNTIGAFDRHADGTLTPQPGSPFPAGVHRLAHDADTPLG